MSQKHPAVIARLSGIPQDLQQQSSPTATEQPYTQHRCLVLVLQLVPLHDRLARCALVSRAWASAAAAATTSIDFIINRDVVGQDVHPSMLRWLQKHGHAVTSIKGVQPYFDPSYFGGHVELPCAVLTNLRSLSLQGMSVELAEGHGSELSTASKPRKCRKPKKKGAKTGVPALLPDGSAPAVSKSNAISAKTAAGTTTKPVAAPASDASAAARHFGYLGLALPTGSLASVLPRLQGLQLVGCAFAGLKLLPRITDLTTLVLNNLDMELMPEPNFSSIFEETLRKLTGLLELRFSYSSRNRPALQSNTLDVVTSLQQLQRLELMVSGKLDNSFLGKLPASLTALHLQAEGKQEDFHDVLDLYDAPLLQGLNGLQELSLKRIVMDPSRLAAFGSTLTFLQLEAVIGTPETGAPALLGSLQQLSRLQHLALAGNFWVEDPSEVPWLLQSLSALTAASGLTSLHIYNPHEEQPLPTGALRYILPAGKHLPALKVLRISCNPGLDSPSCEVDDGGHWCVDGHNIHSIADCCPNLEQLTLHSVVSLDLDRGCLSKLPSSLRTLSLESAAFEKGAARCVARLTGLRCLHWRDNLTKDKELRELTALTRLTQLHVMRCPSLSAKIKGGKWMEWMSSGTEPRLLLQQAMEGEGLAVWQQLQHLYSKHRPEAKVSGRTAKSSGLTGPRSKPNGWGSRRVY